MASDITLAVGDGARRMTYAELAAVRGHHSLLLSVWFVAGAGPGRSGMTALSGYLSHCQKRETSANARSARWPRPPLLQPRTRGQLILDVPDPRAHGPAGHLIRWQRHEQGLERGRVRRIFPQPDRPGFGLEYHWHAIVKL